jgi:hypothetical protein
VHASDKTPSIRGRPSLQREAARLLLVLASFCTVAGDAKLASGCVRRALELLDRAPTPDQSADSTSVS